MAGVISADENRKKQEISTIYVQERSISRYSEVLCTCAEMEEANNCKARSVRWMDLRSSWTPGCVQPCQGYQEQASSTSDAPRMMCRPACARAGVPSAITVDDPAAPSNKVSHSTLHRPNRYFDNLSSLPTTCLAPWGIPGLPLGNIAATCVGYGVKYVISKPKQIHVYNAHFILLK